MSNVLANSFSRTPPRLSKMSSGALDSTFSRRPQNRAVSPFTRSIETPQTLTPTCRVLISRVSARPHAISSFPNLSDNST